MSQANTVAKKRAPITVPGKALPAKLCKSTVPDDAEANIRDQRGAKMGQPCKRMSQTDRYKKLTFMLQSDPRLSDGPLTRSQTTNTSAMCLVFGL